LDTLEYHTHDKSGWGDGPWTHEPDKRQWQDPATGLPCLIVRNGVGALCGYVGVAAGHPLYGKGYDELLSVRCHGGLTFASRCSPGPEDRAICHIPGDGESDDVWWFGFDACHWMDLAPGMEAQMRTLIAGHRSHGIYRDLGYMQREVARLAAQLQALV
jgi:hypothetical protein